jgi:LacI family transcriptional regulator
VRVPADVSIVGCDDVELARLVTPELTTVHVPARELGARAARLLVQQLAEGGARPAEEEDGRTAPAPRRATPRRPLAVRLVVRGTSGRAPEGP